MKASPPRTVLMVSYAFPPEAYVGGRRTLKYCKYLGEFGWRPIVITIRPRASAAQDERLARQLPADVTVLRTPDLDGMEWVGRLSRWWHRVRGRAAHQPAAGGGSQPAGSPATRQPGMFARFKQLVFRLLLESPDSHVPWVPIAFLRGAHVLLTRRVDAVYSTSPPHSSHLAAFLLAKCFRKPHIVDFRDPWVVNGRFRFQALVRRLVISHASEIVVVSPGEPDELLAEFPALDSARITVLTNGYDPEDFPRQEPPARDAARFTITHAGTLYRETGREFFQALEELAADRDVRQRLQVNLIGDIDPVHEPAIQRLQAAGLVRTFGFLPHAATLACTQSSDVLLLLQRGATSAASHIPAKVFEYLFLEKPVLAIVARGSLSEILEASGLGVVVPPDDVTGLAQTIRRLVVDGAAGRLRVQPDRVYIGQFERRKLTGRFAGVLDAAVSV